MSSEEKLPPLNELFPLDDRPGPARFSSKQRQDMIQGAIEGWQAEMPGNAPTLRRRRTGRVIAIAALTFGLTTAAAALWYGVSAIGKREPDRPAAGAPRPGRAVETGDEATATPGVVPPGDEAQAREATRENRAAQDLLQLANRMRGERRWKEAEQTYQRVYLQYPGSMSAYVARVAAGSIRLDHLGDARGALQLFREAVAARPGGSLEIEARQGIARSWQRLGDDKREREALDELLQKDPSGPAAEQARRRLEVIAGER